MNEWKEAKKKERMKEQNKEERGATYFWSSGKYSKARILGSKKAFSEKNKV